MPGALLRIDDRDLARVDRRAIDIEKLGDTAPLMADIAGSLEAWSIRSFETETAPDGTPWKKSKRALEEGGQTLTISGRLRMSVNHTSTAKAAEVGSNLIYAGVHQGGAVIRPKNAKALIFKVGGQTVAAQKVTIPARPYMGIDDAALGDIVRDYLEGGLAR